MTKKNFFLIFNIAVIVLLVSCGLSPLAPAVTPSPTFVSSGPLSAAFMRSTYRLGDTLEFTIRLENNGTSPVTTPVTLTLEGTYNPGGNYRGVIPRRTYRPIPFWSRTQEETLEPGEKRALTYTIPFDLYHAIGTGDYELRVEALGAGVRVGTDVISILDVTIIYPEKMQVGQTLKFQAVITNMASFDAHDIKVYGALPSGIAESLGTLPAYGSKTVTFTRTSHMGDAYMGGILFVTSSDGGNVEANYTTIFPPTPVPTP